MKKTLFAIIYFGSLLTGLSLILAYLSTWVSPEKIWVLSIFGLIYPYLLGLSLLLLVYWLFRKPRNAFYMLLIILLGYSHMRSHFQLGSGSREQCEGVDSLTVLSYNVRLFNYYGGKGPTEEYRKMKELILSQKADILCLQEILLSNWKGGVTLEKLKKDFSSYPYVHFKLLSKPGDTRSYGNIILSSLPMQEKGEINFGKGGEKSIYSDIVLGNDTIRVYNNHLQSFRLGSRNIDFINDIEHQLNESSLDELQDISIRLKAAYIKRARQADMLRDHINACELPLIICGDFNDTPVSYVYRSLSRGMQDSFIEAGSGFGKTYEQLMPSFRIDYILHSKDINTCDFTTIRKRLSDHYPVVACIKTKP